MFLFRHHPSFGRGRSAARLVLVISLLRLTFAVATPAGAGSSVPGGTKTDVTFGPVRFDVPSTWPVVDLAPTRADAPGSTGTRYTSARKERMHAVRLGPSDAPTRCRSRPCAGGGLRGPRAAEEGPRAGSAFRPVRGTENSRIVAARFPSLGLRLASHTPSTRPRPTGSSIRSPPPTLPHTRCRRHPFPRRPLRRPGRAGRPAQGLRRGPSSPGSASTRAPRRPGVPAGVARVALPDAGDLHRRRQPRLCPAELDRVVDRRRRGDGLAATSRPTSGSRRRARTNRGSTRSIRPRPRPKARPPPTMRPRR